MLDAMYAHEEGTRHDASGAALPQPSILRCAVRIARGRAGERTTRCRRTTRQTVEVLVATLDDGHGLAWMPGDRMTDTFTAPASPRTGPGPLRRSRNGWASREGAPLPLGVAWVAEDRAWNFALYSKHAERVTLLLYSVRDIVRPALAVALDPLHHK